jgi:hypothetical protein
MRRYVGSRWVLGRIWANEIRGEMPGGITRFASRVTRHCGRSSSLDVIPLLASHRSVDSFRSGFASWMSGSSDSTIHSTQPNSFPMEMQVFAKR